MSDRPEDVARRDQQQARVREWAWELGERRRRLEAEGFEPDQIMMLLLQLQEARLQAEGQED